MGGDLPVDRLTTGGWRSDETGREIPESQEDDTTTFTLTADLELSLRSRVFVSMSPSVFGEKVIDRH